MKNRLIRFAALFVYLCILLAAVNFHWKELFSPKLAILVIAGTICLSVPELLQNHHAPAEILSKNAISAGILQTFLLFFAGSSDQMAASALTYQSILCFRPLFYGYCLYVLLYTEKTAVLPPNREKELIDPYPKLREFGLTRREAEIAKLLLKDFSNREIANELVIAEATVKKHISNIFLKLGINHREQLSELIYSCNALR